MPSKSTAVAAQNDETHDVALFGAFDDADLGFGSVDSSDYAVPRIGILGELSPQVRKTDPKYIQGAEPGMLADVGLGELFPESIHFLPVLREKVWLEWGDRKANIGIVNRFDYDVIKERGLERNDRNEYKTKEGTEIIQTVQLYGLNLSAGGRPSFVSLKKSGLKTARQFLTKASMLKLPNGRQAPLFYKSYILSSFQDQGNGNSWFALKIEDGPTVTDLPNWQELVETAKAFQQSVSSGEKRADLREDDVADSDEAPF